MEDLEYYDDENQQFIYETGQEVRFEYSLKAVYEWEQKWRKPFLKGGLTDEELIDFYVTMAIDPFDSRFLTMRVVKLLADYMQQPNTATTFTTVEGTGRVQKKAKVYSAEEIYALMFSAGIDLEFENRNLSRLLVILKIISTQNEPQKNMSRQDILRQNASLNAQRKAQLKTKG